MTNYLKTLIFLFLISATVNRIGTDTLVTPVNNAEEEKKFNFVSSNFTPKATFRPSDYETTTSFPVMNEVGDDETTETEDESREEGVLPPFKANSNFTEYDDLHEDNKNDASPENSVDSSKFVNALFTSITDLTTPMYKENVSTITDLIFSVNTTTVFTTASDEISTLTTPSIPCSDSDEKCKSLAMPGEEHFVSPVPDTKSPISVPGVSLSAVTYPSWNYVKPQKPQEQSPPYPGAIPSETNVSTDMSVTSNVDSTTAPTSENLIPVEGLRISKSESSLDVSTNKSEKAKPVKFSTFSPDRPLTTFLKAITTTPITTVTKTGVSEENSTASTLLTKIKEVVTRVSDFSDLDAFPYANTSASWEPILHSPKFSGSYKTEELTPSSLPMPNAPDIAVTSSWYNYDIPEKTNDAVAPRLTPSFHSFSHFITRSSETPPPSVSPDVPSYTTSDILTPTTVRPYLTTPVVTKDLSPMEEAIEENLVVEKNIPPPRLSYPGCSSLPKCIEMTLLETTWEEFCPQVTEFQKFISKAVSHYTRPIRPHQIILDAENCVPKSSLYKVQASPDITVALYVIDDNGEYDERLTEICSIILRKWAPTTFRNSILEVRLYGGELQSTAVPEIPELNSGFVAAVSISAVAGVALCMLCVLLVVMKQKLLQTRNSSESTSPTADAYSLDSLSINASFRRKRNRKSARSYLNHAFADQEVPSHPLNEKTLQNGLKNKDLLEEEFRRLPMNMPKLDQIPEGAHVKNRYSNILPRPESRVVLAEPSGDALKCYINANYVKGYGGKAATYIACQAPLPEGIEDFWRMVWEQQCRVIIMLTKFEENGSSRCALYFPQSTLVSHPPHGDFQVSLIKKDVYEHFTMSTLRVLDLEKNLFRDIVHLWYTCWPDVGVPKDPSNLITFVQHCRSFINCNTGPTVVHCSTGTGRTGVFVALDLCIREYEESKSIDILQTVSQIRKERAGAVQNKDQYILIHEAMLEYICRMSNQSLRPSLQNGN